MFWCRTKLYALVSTGLNDITCIKICVYVEMMGNIWACLRIKSQLENRFSVEHERLESYSRNLVSHFNALSQLWYRSYLKFKTIASKCVD